MIDLDRPWEEFAMRDEHFSRDTAEQFFRSELPQSEAMLFVRHLLRQCPSCGKVLREIAQKRHFRLALLRASEDSGSYGEKLLDGLRGRGGAKARDAAGPWRMIRRA
jgi:hypothetical protein